MGSKKKCVIIGVDPHRMSVTIEVVDSHERLLRQQSVRHHQRRVCRDAPLCEAVAYRVWAVEGANGAGRPLARRLVAAGEQVVDVPAKLAARVWLFDTGTTIRPTPWTPTPSRSSRSVPMGCGWWSRTVSSRRCGC